MTFKDFDAAEAERTGDPVRFRLGGQDWTAAHLNAPNLLDFTRALAEGGMGVVIAFDDFIRAVLPAEDVPAFRAMLLDRDISLAGLMEVGQWIVERASGAPFGDASPSPPSRSRRGQRPRVVSLSPGSTGQGSASAAG